MKTLVKAGKHVQSILGNPDYFVPNTYCCISKILEQILFDIRCNKRIFEMRCIDVLDEARNVRIEKVR